MKAPLEHEVMAGFVARLDEINALADRSEGFVWRLQGSGGNATYLRPYDDDRILFNLSVWESIEHLKNYVYRSAHAELIKERKQWFEHFEAAYMALWWIPAGHVPGVDEAKKRLAASRRERSVAVRVHVPFDSPTGRGFSLIVRLVGLPALRGESLIRRAVPADAANLAALGARTFEEAFAAQNRPEDMTAYLAKTYSEPLQRREIEDPDVVTLLVEESGLLIAFAQMRRGPVPPLMPLRRDGDRDRAFLCRQPVAWTRSRAVADGRLARRLRLPRRGEDLAGRVGEELARDRVLREVRIPRRWQPAVRPRQRSADGSHHGQERCEGPGGKFLACRQARDSPVLHFIPFSSSPGYVEGFSLRSRSRPNIFGTSFPDRTCCAVISPTAGESLNP